MNDNDQPTICTQCRYSYDWLGTGFRCAAPANGMNYINGGHIIFRCDCQNRNLHGKCPEFSKREPRVIGWIEKAWAKFTALLFGEDKCTNA